MRGQGCLGTPRDPLGASRAPWPGLGLMRAGAGSSLEGAESDLASPCWQGLSRCALSLGGPVSSAWAFCPCPQLPPSPRAQGWYWGPLPGLCQPPCSGSRTQGLLTKVPRPPAPAPAPAHQLCSAPLSRGCLGPWRGHGGPGHSAVGTLPVGRPTWQLHVPGTSQPAPTLQLASCFSSVCRSVGSDSV